MTISSLEISRDSPLLNVILEIYPPAFSWFILTSSFYFDEVTCSCNSFSTVNSIGMIYGLALYYVQPPFPFQPHSTAATARHA